MESFCCTPGDRFELWIRPHPRGLGRYVRFDPIGTQDYTPPVAVRRGGTFELNVLRHHVAATAYVPGAYRLGMWLNRLLRDREDRQAEANLPIGAVLDRLAEHAWNRHVYG